MTVSLAETAGTLWLTLLRPPVNALDLQTVTDLTRVVEDTSPDAPLVLTGKGKSFCAGVDTSEFARYTPDERRELVLAITRMVKALVCHPAPVVAAINGHAIGGGLVLALTADYRIAAAPEGKFGLAEARAGVPFPAGPREVIASEVPAPLLRSLALTSRMITQEVLLEHGLVDQVCKPDSLPIIIAKAVRQLKSQPAFAAIKAQVRGRLQDRLRALADSGEDPFLDAFGAD